jgi:hypothetical protein
MPTSISPSLMTKLALPTAGIVQADRPGRIHRFAGGGDHFIERGALGGPGAANLPHHDFAGHAAALFDFVLRRRRGIVVGDDRAHTNAFALGQLDCHLHIHVVAGVIAIEARNAGAAIGRLERFEERFGSGRREDFSDRHGIHQVTPNIADERRFVP